jgi:hypothetical protein
MEQARREHSEYTGEYLGWDGSLITVPLPPPRRINNDQPSLKMI